VHFFIAGRARDSIKCQLPLAGTECFSGKGCKRLGSLHQTGKLSPGVEQVSNVFRGYLGNLGKV
jgi:hypothetical protein